MGARARSLLAVQSFDTEVTIPMFGAHLDPKICRTQSISRAHIRIDTHLAANVYVTNSPPRVPLLADIDMT